MDSKIVLAPYPDMPHKIALTAWTRLLVFEKVEEEAMLRFVSANINHAPERVQ